MPRRDFLTLEERVEIRHRVREGLPLPGDPLNIPRNVKVYKAKLEMVLDYLNRLERKDGDYHAEAEEGL